MAQSGSRNVSRSYFLITEAKVGSAGIAFSGHPVARQKLAWEPPGCGFHFVHFAFTNTYQVSNTGAKEKRNLCTHEACILIERCETNI